MSRFFARFLLAIPRILWYAVLGAVSSTPVGGSPRSFGGDLFFCPQLETRGGDGLWMLHGKEFFNSALSLWLSLPWFARITTKRDNRPLSKVTVIS